MRTKTLLFAAAALAAGIVSSEAQNVYSQNIVGYVNVVIPTSPGWACVANPLDLDGVDNVTNVMSGVPKGTTVEYFSGVSGFSVTIKRSAVNGSWPAAATNAFCPPGLGFMVQAGGSTPYTNTFVGNVVVNSPGTNVLNLTSSQYQLVGSPIPYGGTLTNAGDTGPGTLNLGAVLPKGSQIQTWNNGFSLAAQKSAVSGNWNANPTFVPAQGFILKPGAGATNWTQTLN